MRRRFVATAGSCVLRFVAVAVAIAVTLAVAGPATAQFFLRQVFPDNAFFRFKAQYVVKATGEVVDFDLVRPCQPKYARDATGDSVDLGPLGGGKLEPDSHFGAVDRFPKVTKDHHVIVVKIPRACDGQTTANGRVPPDLLPYASWYEDADDISEGLLYATEDAYRSPVAKIEFRGASIKTGTPEDFRNWVQHAADGFRPSKDITSPLGFTQKDTFGWGHISQTCEGVERLAFPPEIVPRIAEIWPSGHPHFWSWRATEQAGHREALREVDADIFAYKTKPYSWVDGISPKQYGNYENRESVPTRAHGSIDKSGRRPLPVFPFSHIPDGLNSTPPGKTPDPSSFYFNLDLRPEMQGFLYCRQRDPLVGEMPPRPEMGEHVVEHRANGEPIFGEVKRARFMAQATERFFEDDKYTYYVTRAH
ncbi:MULTISPECIES: hypothetical protein [Bradyrhizobium]|uniref:hypothetical protein n=1 Tax=Bradyrhizobium TaxID=374 RepID=UPI000406E8A3|nr:MULTISPECIES: hypothetical protein [Bradyrhizobium]UFW48211.1 hypothetical protein BaraCB756_39120 [Bradyrhizobium arachidis]